MPSRVRRAQVQCNTCGVASVWYAPFAPLLPKGGGGALQSFRHFDPDKVRVDAIDIMVGVVGGNQLEQPGHVFPSSDDCCTQEKMHVFWDCTTGKRYGMYRVQTEL